MGLNTNLLRARMFPTPNTKVDAGNKKTNDETETKTENTVSNESSKTSTDFSADNIENTYTYFSIYDGITTRLGNFYSETLAKMTGSSSANKNVFNIIYNSTMQNVVNNALESAKSGNKLDYNELAQAVKNQITEKLEACNYSPFRYFAQ